ncbi:hypothetical protein [Enemella evansiae]|uniref:Integral membrane protein n=1 Tax=Enemella evansiae TaxID=2016499 RepID=A0A255GEY3_9ACTN|nr:hypothetical protein [Enemella evansiae]PFG67558.1 hypothetical protein B0O41_2377 [Propionibacteriaceae bacterium ES.041]OYN98930.1 hypothetical protein CGZ96_06585 [Enemella evansiae]OYO01244.1 hypothetical protein CGZ97_17595 [Enemella evansiae]OYO05044.1 hypothetical protein CGZ95_01695 [Enemella evansiae]OYO07505.1 hypothetical protein CGZ98_18830 [Enemella evansiae]
MPETPETTAPAASRPRTLIVAALILLLEGLVCVVLGVLDAFNVRGNRPVVGVGGAIILIGYGLALGGLLAGGLLRMRTWSRGPVVATQLINLPIAWSFFGGATWPIAVALGAASIVVIGCVLHPASTRVLVRDAAD